jgi:hypothetical protein
MSLKEKIIYGLIVLVILIVIVGYAKNWAQQS